MGPDSKSPILSTSTFSEWKIIFKRIFKICDIPAYSTFLTMELLKQHKEIHALSFWFASLRKAGINQPTFPGCRCCQSVPRSNKAPPALYPACKKLRKFRKGNAVTLPSHMTAMLFPAVAHMHQRFPNSPCKLPLCALHCARVNHFLCPRQDASKCTLAHIWDPCPEVLQFL